MIRQIAILLGLLAVGRPVPIGEASQLLPPDAPGPIVKGPSGKVAAGDTLVYTISWGPGARATSYNYRLAVTASNGTWTVAADSNSAAGKFTSGTLLPDVRGVTSSLLKTWLSAIPWDSATFTVSVSSQNAAGTSATVATTWKVLRKPGPPGPPTIDSSLAPTSTLVLPNPATLALGATRTVCAFKQFGNGAVAQWTADKPGCDSIYVAYVPATARNLVTAAQQAHTDSLAKTCVSWASSQPLLVSITPRASCSAAAAAVGLGLTLRFPADGLRYAAR